MAEPIALAYRTWGAGGPPLVLLHGIGGGSSLWAPIAERLARRWRVYAPDARGHGRSPLGDGQFGLPDFTADLARFLDDHQLDTPVLVGHSFGACVALNYAAQQPDRVRALAAIEAILYPPDYVMRPRPELIERARKRVQVWPDRATMRAYLATRPVHRRWRLDLLDRYVQDCTVERPDGQVEAHFCPDLEARFIETVYADPRFIYPWEHFRAIRCPVWFLRAAESPWLSEAALAAAVAVLADVETATLPATSHFLILEEPDAVADRLEDWLARRVCGDIVPQAAFADRDEGRLDRSD
ncbi:MAG: alpha/beta hydrolase, partial [Thermoleophilum sp.]|nr:alpha/beta hydrolase [Thermoleophilum sp.]